MLETSVSKSDIASADSVPPPAPSSWSWFALTNEAITGVTIVELIRLFPSASIVLVQGV